MLLSLHEFVNQLNCVLDHVVGDSDMSEIERSSLYQLSRLLKRGRDQFLQTDIATVEQ